MKPNVHFITPHRADKNFGKGINMLIEGLPEDDWICLRDIDTVPLHHRVLAQQCEEIAAAGEYGLVGAMTNRIGLTYQLHNGKISEDFDIKNHVEIAHQRYEEFGSLVEDSEFLIAGMFMLFPKKVWSEMGGFPEGSIRIDGKFLDYIFSENVKKLGYKVGIAKGIYIFHIYREWLENVRVKYEHLL